MAKEIAKKLVDELLANEAKKDEFMKDPEAFLATAGYDCTVSEVKEAYTLNRELDDEELSTLSGGARCSVLWAEGARGNGNCGGSFYKESCAATVEKGSWCGSNDYCGRYQVVYHCTQDFT